MSQDADIRFAVRYRGKTIDELDNSELRAFLLDLLEQRSLMVDLSIRERDAKIAELKAENTKLWRILGADA